MFRSVFFVMLFSILLTGSAFAETIEGLPLHVQKFESGAIRVWIEDYISSSATIAFPTSEGLVIIDTTGNPTVDQKLRQVIAREFGRDDFKTLINTHEHGDHTGGNSVYADCTIIGHELVAEGMARQVENRQRTIDWLTNRIPELISEIEESASDNPELPRLKEQLIQNQLQLAHAKENSELYPPTLTFSNKMNVNFGDTNFELSYIGGMHTASDIAIFVPEHGMLLTGDTMADVWLTDTPGCLASFIARPGIKHDFPLLLANWNALLDKKDEIRTLVPSHWNGELTFAGFENRVKYVEALWNGTGEAVSDGKNLTTMFGSFGLAERFPELVNSPGCSQGNNFTTITEMWAAASNQQSAAEVLYDLIDQGADSAVIRQVVTQFGDDKSAYYFLETQINMSGYRFLQADKVEQAIAMFKIYTEIFSDSWNAYDSFGEALYAGGKYEQALASYEKSFELNPESPTNRQILDEIKKSAAVN